MSISVQGTFPVPYFGILASFIVGLLGSACFHASLRGQFVFDDAEAIINNADIQLKTPISNIFWNDFWGTRVTSHGSHKSYRPLTVLSFRLNMWLNDGLLNPYSFHLFNIILHGLASGLTLPLFQTLFGTKVNWKVPLLATVLFAIHPVHSEAVAGIVGRADLLCAVLYFSSLLVYFKATTESDKRKTAYLCFLSCFLAGLSMFAKEQGITVLAVCSAYDILIANSLHPIGIMKNLISSLNYGHQRCEVKKNFKANNSKTDKTDFPQAYKLKLLFIRHVIMFIFGGALVYMRWWIMGFKAPDFQKVDNPASFMDGPLLRMLNYNYLYAVNAWLLLCPEWLCFDWSMGCVPLLKIDGIYPDRRIVAVILFWSVLISIFLRTMKVQNSVSRRLMMGLAFMVIPFSLATNLLFRVGFVLAERVLYLPSVGYCMIVAMGVDKLTKYHKFRKVVYSSLMMLFLVNVLRCHERSLEWENERTLFTSGLKVCPLNAKVHYNLAKTAANTSVAIRHYEEALRLHPEYEQAMNNLANILRNEGETYEAERLLRKAVSLRPDFAAAWMNLGIVLSNMNRFNEALKCYSNALIYRKHYPDCYYNLGNLFLAQKKYVEAFSAWKKATTQKPTHSIAWNNMIVMLDSIGKFEEAKSVGLRALERLPNDPALHFNLANTLGKLGLHEDAEKHFLVAIELKPFQAIYHTNLGVLYHRWKKYYLAEEQYMRALQLDNNLSSVEQNLKNVQKIMAKSKLSEPQFLEESLPELNKRKSFKRVVEESQEAVQWRETR